jgi:hypothetical protein
LHFCQHRNPAGEKKTRPLPLKGKGRLEKFGFLVASNCLYLLSESFRLNCGFYLPKKKGGCSCCFSLFFLADCSLMPWDVGLSLIRMHRIKVRNTLVFSCLARFIQGSFLYAFGITSRKEDIFLFRPVNF